MKILKTFPTDDGFYMPAEFSEHYVMPQERLFVKSLKLSPFQKKSLFVQGMMTMTVQGLCCPTG